MGFRELAREHQGLARVVDELAKDHAITRGGLNQVAQAVFVNPKTGKRRGLIGRIRWLLLGR